MNQQTKDDLITIAKYDGYILDLEKHDITLSPDRLFKVIRKEYLTLDKLFEVAEKLELWQIRFYLNVGEEWCCSIIDIDKKISVDTSERTPELALLSALGRVLNEML